MKSKNLVIWSIPVYKCSQETLAEFMHTDIEKQKEYSMMKYGNSEEKALSLANKWSNQYLQWDYNYIIAYIELRIENHTAVFSIVRQFELKKGKLRSFRFKSNKKKYLYRTDVNGHHIDLFNMNSNIEIANAIKNEFEFLIKEYAKGYYVDKNKFDLFYDKIDYLAILKEID